MKQLRTCEKDFWRYGALKHMRPWYSTLSTTPLVDRVSEEFKEAFDIGRVPEKLYSRLDASLNYEL